MPSPLGWCSAQRICNANDCRWQSYLYSLRWPSVSEVGRGSCEFAETLKKGLYVTALFRPCGGTFPKGEGFGAINSSLLLC